jgi:hemerythrin
MECIEWNESLSVGNVLMDAHHRIFFEAIREFNAFPGKNDREAIRQRIEFLLEYAAMHLGAEERLMREANFPGFEEHKVTHDAFVRNLQSIKVSFDENPNSVSGDGIMEIMQEWLLHHIAGSDKKYMPYMKNLQS